ncbi:MAG: hypothetical protein ACO1SV_21230 [Fimbriimonas sp.]
MRFPRPFLRFAVVGLFVVPGAVALGQTRKALAEALPSLQWDAAKSGPLLVIDAARVRSKSEKTDLADFARQSVKVGDLTAIVPTEMVTIDDSFRDSGSLTDGLPAEAKVLYLLQTLSPPQWKLATGKGIGLADLQGEQKAVMESLLPNRLAWSTYRVKEDGMDTEPVGKGEVPSDKLHAVRLRVVRDLSLEVGLATREAYTVHRTDHYRGKPGDLILTRDDQFEEGNHNFGIAPRQTVRNALKPAHLPYTDAAYDGFVDLAPSITVKEALAAIGRTTGTEIYADLRVADLKITLIGQKVRTRDLLKAIALGVTGTYRRVGSAYVLTSDLMGLGARKLRFALWWEDMMQRNYRLRQEWQKKIGDRIDAAAFDKSSPFAPNAAMRAHLDVQDENPNRDYLPIHEATPFLRDYLIDLEKQYRNQPLDKSRVRLESSFRFGFVLPDGRPLRFESQSLGDRNAFETRPLRDTIERPKAELPVVLAEGDAPARLAVRAENAALARSAVELASSRGFRELWLETNSQATLDAAIEAGAKRSMPVRLMIRPWSARTSDPDRTVLGDAGPQIVARLEGLDVWKMVLRNTPGSSLVDYERVAPTDPTLPAAWAAFAKLAASPGLAGVVVSDLLTRGYEGAVRGTRGLSPGISASRQFGYSVGQRLAFLRRHGMDPIDIVVEDLTAGPDLRQPFFLDDELRGTPTTYDGRDVPHPGVAKARRQWVEFRGKAAEDAISSLLNDLAKSTKVMVNVIDPGRHPLPFGEEVLVAWQPGTKPPTMETLQEASPSDSERPGVLAALPADPQDPRAANLAWIFKGNRVNPTIDLRAVPSGTWSTLLDRWIRRETP